jgi:hypothetical protein
VAETEPEVIVHQLTAFKGEPGLREMRNPDRFAAMTHRLCTEGTDHLLAAGRAVGIRRFIAQSIAIYARTGGPVKTEDDPLDLDLPAKGRSVANAVRYLEDAVTGIEGAEGLVLRYGGFYGPGTDVSADPEAVMTKPIRKRRFPIIGEGGGIWSFVHIEDAASATVAAVDNGGPGIYNVVDDEPAPVRDRQRPGHVLACRPRRGQLRRGHRFDAAVLHPGLRTELPATLYRLRSRWGSCGLPEPHPRIRAPRNRPLPPAREAVHPGEGGIASRMTRF